MTLRPSAHVSSARQFDCAVGALPRDLCTETPALPIPSHTSHRVRTVVAMASEDFKKSMPAVQKKSWNKWFTMKVGQMSRTFTV